MGILATHCCVHPRRLVPTSEAGRWIGRREPAPACFLRCPGLSPPDTGGSQGIGSTFTQIVVEYILTSPDLKLAKALFSSQKILQNFSDSPSHRIFRHMHGVLNIDEKKLIAQFSRN